MAIGWNKPVGRAGYSPGFGHADLKLFCFLLGTNFS